VKRFTLILVLVILISLAVVTPVFAGGGPNGKACENVYISGWFWGHRQWWAQIDKFGEAKGRFYGPVVARLTICH
jgi:hypothetical protein